MSRQIWALGWWIVLSVAIVVDMAYPIAAFGLGLGILLQICATKWLDA